MAKSGEIRQRTTNKVVEVQSNHLNFKQKLAGKNCILKNQRKPTAVLQKAMFCKLTTRMLSDKVRIWKQEFFPKSRVLSIIFFKKSLKNFFAQTEGQRNNEEMLRIFGEHTLEAVFQVTRVTVDYREGQKQLKSIAFI